MEKHDDSELTNWVTSQNEKTQDHYELVKKEYSSAFKIKEFDYYSSNSMPLKKGRYFYSSYRRDKDKPAALYYRKELNETPKELFYSTV